MIDLMSIARIEADGGDLFGALQALYKPTEVRPNGFPKAVEGMRTARAIFARIDARAKK